MADDDNGNGNERKFPTEEIARLARLSYLDYELQRAKVAERLGCRKLVLDRAVLAERAKIEAAEKPVTQAKPKGNGPWPAGQAIAPTEHAISEAFVGFNTSELRYNHTSGDWHIWDGALWRRDERMEAYARVREFATTVNHPDQGKKKLVDALERFARVDQRMATTHADWDHDPLLLGTPNGTVNLRNGELTCGRPEDLISKSTLVAPSDDDECPIFDDFINFALNGDAAAIAFLDRYLGYCLTGLTSEEFLLFMHGREGTGKGTLTKTVMSIMGDYARAVPIEMFTEKNSRHEYYRAVLTGNRLIVAAEPDRGVSWSEGFVNEATGSDIISGRHPAGRPFEFAPSHKLIIHGNSVPDLKNAASGLKRRLGLMSFPHQPDQPDVHLKDRLRQEYPAILRRMINGCLAYQREGLNVPPGMRAATDAYFERQNAFKRFLADVTDPETGTHNLLPGAKMRSGELLQVYNAWANRNGERRLNSNRLYELIDNDTDAALKNVTGHANQRSVEGLAPRPEPDPRQPQKSD